MIRRIRAAESTRLFSRPAQHVSFSLHSFSYSDAAMNGYFIPPYYPCPEITQRDCIC